MKVKEIVRQFLVREGYDGLVNEDAECACGPEDLMPCCEPGMWCEAGHEVRCDCGEGHDFHIVPGRRPTEETSDA